jgi:nitronate monooxygenase
MWNETEVARRLGIKYPIIQGPFGGGVSSAELAASVSNAGGLGSYGANHMAPEQIGQMAAEIRARTTQPFALNLWIPQGPEPTLTQESFERALTWFAPYYRELGIAAPTFPNRFGQDYQAQVAALLEAKPPVFSFVFGIPSDAILRACRQRGIVTIGTATTVDEARTLDEAGIDAIVATGFEAGGHRPAFRNPPEAGLSGTMVLLPQIVDRVKAPVIAAGGIADGRGIVAALALGAQGVQIGTAFLACDESGASPAHREALWSEQAQTTVLTRIFSGRLARYIRNRYAEEMSVHESEVPPYPIQNWFTGSLRKAAIEQGRSDLISLTAGQVAPLLLRHRKAAVLMAQLIGETAAVLQRLAPGSA